MAADGYKQKVERAFLAAQEILGSLTVASERVATDTEHKVEEVEVKCYDSDSLSSPPPSSEESDKDSDPLLDFSRDDDLTHNPVTAGPAMVRRAIEAQRALEGMQSITRGVQEKRQRKEEKSRLVSTQTEFTPLFSKGENVGRHPQPLKETSQQVQAEKQPSGAASSSQQSSGAASSTQQSSGASSSSQQSSGASSSSQQSSGASSSSQQSHRVIPETSQHSLPPISHHSLPPPIPPYSPERPDSFLLSNKPEYHHSVSTKHEQLAPHPKQVDKEDVMVLTAGARPPAPLNVALRTKRKGAEPLPTPEQEGHVADLERKQTSFVPQVVPTATEVTDIYEEAACKGLPGSVHVWRKEEVGVWLKQLSPTLYQLYWPCFAKHDITGRALMRLNESKLKAMDITAPKHCRLLATQIARLKIKQEAMELWELSGKGEISYL